jgi:hypothetical protein
VLYRPRNRSQTDRRTDGRTDGRHNDFSRAHFLKKCSNNSFVKRFVKRFYNPWNFSSVFHCRVNIFYMSLDISDIWPLRPCPNLAVSSVHNYRQIFPMSTEFHPKIDEIGRNSLKIRLFSRKFCPILKNRNKLCMGICVETLRPLDFCRYKVRSHL